MAKAFGVWGDPSMLVLGSLAGGPKHGWAIIEDVEATTRTRLGPGTLYGALARLEERGLVHALPSDDRRKPYEITAAGAAALQESAESMRSFARMALRRLDTQVGPA
jgi:DNA-binding PadR family transcriptional regulator